MPSFNGTFEYLAPGSGVVEAGAASVSFDAETLVLSGRSTPLALDLGDIDLFEGGEYDLRLVLYTGHALRLKQFGKSFQDLSHHLLDAYRDRLVKCLLVSDLDEVARYAARVQLESPHRACGGPAEIRLYESNLAVLPDAAAGFQWRLAEIDEVSFDEREYAVVVRRGRERLRVGRLAKRTGELMEHLDQQMGVLRERSARVLHALFPFLSPEQFRQAAGLMREGASTSIVALRGVHRLIEPALLEQAVDGALKPYLQALVGRTPAEGWHAGFKIVREDREEEREGDGPDDGGAIDDEAVDASDEQVSAEDAGPAPAAAAIALADGLEVLCWFFVPIAAASGGTASRVAWEASSRGGRATYVFRPAAGSGAGIAGLEEGLAAVNFRREPIYLAQEALESAARYRHYAIAARKVPELSALRAAFVGRALHRTLPSWRRQLEALLAG
jgi:hypothetical protein